MRFFDLIRYLRSDDGLTPDIRFQAVCAYLWSRWVFPESRTTVSGCGKRLNLQIWSLIEPTAPGATDGVNLRWQPAHGWIVSDRVDVIRRWETGRPSRRAVRTLVWAIRGR